MTENHGHNEQISRMTDLAKRALNFTLSMMALSLLFATMLLRPDWFRTEKKNTAAPETAAPAPVDDEEKVENGIHLSTGLIFDENFELVRANCTGCHSAALITQNRMTREQWDNTIIWMQKTQNLWDLGPNKAAILDYLEKNYAPTESGRRKNLVINEWYYLNE
jgi:hypothetical protein